MKKLSFLKKTMIVLATIVVLIAFVISLIMNVIFTPEKITPIILGTANGTLKGATCQADQVRLSFLKTFPRFGVEIQNGLIIVPMEDSIAVDNYPSADTLLSFRNAKISFNLIELLLHEKIDIHKITLDQGKLDLVNTEEGQSNWDIMPTDTTSTNTDTTAYSLNLKVSKIQIRDTEIHYQDKAANLYMQLKDIDNDITAELNDSLIFFQTTFEGALTDLQQDHHRLANNLQLTAATHMTLDKKDFSLKISETKATINQLGCSISGQASATGERALDIDLFVLFEIPSLAEAVSLIPDQNFPLKNKLISKGKLTCDAHIEGLLGQGTLPSITGQLKLTDGSIDILHEDQVITLISELSTDITGFYNPNQPEQATIDIQHFALSCPDNSITIDASGKVKDPEGKAEITGKINAKADLSSFANRSPLGDSLKMNGSLNVAVQGTCTVADLMNNDYGKINAMGQAQIHDLNIAYQDSIRVAIPFWEINIGQDQQNKFFDQKGSKVLGGMARGGKIDAFIHELIEFHTDTVFIGFAADPDLDSTRISPMTATMHFANAKLKLGDSLSAHAGNLQAHVSIGANETNKQIPTLHTTFSIDSIMVKQQNLFIGISKGNYDFEITRQSKTEWPATGFIEFEKTYIYSSYFPTLVTLPKTRVSVAPDHIALDHASVHVGASNMTLTGKIYEPDKTIRRLKPLTADLELHSSMINANELMNVMSQSASNEIDTVEVVETADTAMVAFVVPRGIDFTFHSKVDTVKFGDLSIQNMTGDIRLKNEQITLKRLKMQTHAANLEASVQYWNPDSTSAEIDFNFAFDEINMANVISLMPAIDTLLPMATDLEGLLKFNMAGSVALAKDMSMQLQTMEAYSNISGKNLVLMDSETFGQMAKTLMFKNKKRNMIDTAQFAMIIKDNQLEVLPSRVIIDRYAVAVGGTISLDMTYDFQVSILKSPMPFKAGIDVSGDMDDYNIKVTKAKYKYLFSDKEKQQKKIDSIYYKKQLLVTNKLMIYPE